MVRNQVRDTLSFLFQKLITSLDQKNENLGSSVSFVMVPEVLNYGTL